MSPFGGGGQTDFLLTLGTGQAGSDAAQGPRWTVWGQSDLQSFAGERSPTARYDGDLWTTYVGVDARLSERWLAGVAVSRSRGNGDWTVGSSTGRLTTTLTSVQPYLRWSDGGTTIWATGGGGPGTARNALYGLQAESDLELRLGLVEVRRRLATVGGGVELQLRGDASWARLTTAEGDGLIDALAVEVRQLRVGIDVSRPVRTAGGTLVEPFGEVHARRDGGSGQTGAGLEVAGGLRVARGVFPVEGMGRLLALHAADGYREHGGRRGVLHGPPEAPGGPRAVPLHSGLIKRTGKGARDGCVTSCALRNVVVAEPAGSGRICTHLCTRYGGTQRWRSS